MLFKDELNITATSGDRVIMALSHKQYDVKGVQFHPESIMTLNGKEFLGNWINFDSR
jgi:anthranilate synthase component 2